MSDRPYTPKQQGDAGEMLVAAELTLHGIPALKVPDNWPGYDVIVQPPDPSRPPQRISVKTRTFSKGNFVGFGQDDIFDWLAVVILPGEGCPNRRIFIVPRDVAMNRSYYAKHRDGRGFDVHKLVESLKDYEDNFRLSKEPRSFDAL